MIDSLASSGNISAIVAVAFPFVSLWWIAPKLTRHIFSTSFIWGALFLAGQFSQKEEWGSQWVQYHLQDLVSIPWGVACILGVLSLAAKITWLKSLLTERFVIVSSVILAPTGVIASEVWDSITQHAVDYGDYSAFGLGLVAAVAWHGPLFMKKFVLS